MSYDYDALYAQFPNALGKPTDIIVDFFDGLDLSGARILDVGCGQGRDTLFLARRGYHVTGVDLSPSGIAAIDAAAEDEGLDIRGIVADIRSFTPDGHFDVVLLDRTLHMLDQNDRAMVLRRLIGSVEPNGWVMIADEPHHIPQFATILSDDDADWNIALQQKGYLFAQRQGGDPA